MNQMQEKSALKALHVKNFSFINNEKLADKIDTIGSISSDGDLTAKKAEMRAKIEAGNPN